VPSCRLPRRRERTLVALVLITVMVLASGASVNARVRDDRDRGHVGTASARDTGTGESVEHRIDRDNPVLDHDVPDPSVLVTDHGYIAFASGSGGFNVQVTQSKDLAHWREPREGSRSSRRGSQFRHPRCGDRTSSLTRGAM
jgi:hypothetical protein